MTDVVLAPVQRPQRLHQAHGPPCQLVHDHAAPNAGGPEAIASTAMAKHLPHGQALQGSAGHLPLIASSQADQALEEPDFAGLLDEVLSWH